VKTCSAPKTSSFCEPKKLLALRIARINLAVAAFDAETRSPPHQLPRLPTRHALRQSKLLPLCLGATTQTNRAGEFHNAACCGT